jgi:8-oxo-dGTP pyrophosphatase MutT (NUDIX family)
MREIIRKIVEDIAPFDALESEHRAGVLEWIDSGEEIFRIRKPDTPPKHLVSYFVLFDPEREKILLLDHIKAELWLPSGGHVEKDEHPKTTVERESVEELGLPADFISEEPIFITRTVTVGKAVGHTDVSLWYVLRGNSDRAIAYEEREFNGYKWFDPDEILGEERNIFNPHMRRFVKKLFASGIGGHD